jgi:pheromone shutdown protein TraB
MFLKLIFRLVHFIVMLSSLTASAQTRLVIVGTVHNKTSNVSPDSILAVLERIKPDIILLEFDSSFFTKDFRLKRKDTSNESIAAAKYITLHPTPLRPFDLQGRNKYYERSGLLQHQYEAYQKLTRLRSTLTDSEKKAVTEYIFLTSSLEQIATKTLHEINGRETGKYVMRQQTLMSDEILNVVLSHKEMATVRKTFVDEANFWNKRNHAMAANIKRYCELNPGKKIVILTGFYHKPFLIEALRDEYLIEQY